MRMLLLAVLFMFGSSAQAQTYPTRTVRIVVPATPGGAIDLIARSRWSPSSCSSTSRPRRSTPR